MLWYDHILHIHDIEDPCIEDPSHKLLPPSLYLVDCQCWVWCSDHLTSISCQTVWRSFWTIFLAELRTDISSSSSWFPRVFSESTLDVKAIPLPFLSVLLLTVISKFCRDHINSSTFKLEMSWASPIVVTFMSNLLGRDLRIFLTSFSSEIFSPRDSKAFAIWRIFR